MTSFPHPTLSSLPRFFQTCYHGEKLTEVGDGVAPIQASSLFLCSWYWSVHVHMWVKCVQLCVQLCVHCVCKSVHEHCIHQGVYTKSFTHSCGVHTYVHLFRCLIASVHVRAHARMYQCVQEFKDSAIHRTVLFSPQAGTCLEMQTVASPQHCEASPTGWARVADLGYPFYPA